MGTMRLFKSFIATAFIALLSLCQTDIARAQDWLEGDVFVAVGNGQVKQYRNDGTFVQSLDNTTGSGFTTGMAFDTSGNLFVTNFSTGSVSKFDIDGNLVAANWASGISSAPESIVYYPVTDMYYVGTAGGTFDMHKYDATGTLQTSYNPTVGPRGTDWIDLASDGCTMYYGSEGTLIRRFDVCTNTQLADFSTLPGGSNAFALRILGDGDVLVAAGQAVYRLDGTTGSVEQTYTRASLGYGAGASIFALNLDPDGTSFWTADIIGGDVKKVDMATGNVLLTFNGGALSQVAGLAVYKEPTAVSCVPPTITDEPDNATVCTGQSAVFSVTASGDDTLTYQWRKNGVDLVDGGNVSGATTATLTISNATTADNGTYDVIVTNSCDPSDTSAGATLTVHAPPTISVSLDPSELWPPNHTMHTITATITTTGDCGPLTVTLVSATSNEPDNANGNGDGNTVNDIQGATTGTDDRSVDVRAERAASGSGRVYTLTYMVTDAAGNTATASATVTVPHHQDED